VILGERKCSIIYFEPFHDLFKALNRNIILLQEKIIKEGTKEQRNTINKVK